jgi:hypothetical protein
VDGLAAGAGAAEALVGSSTGAVVLLAPNALGEYGVTQTLGLPAKPRLLDFADIDGDGFAEIVTANDEPQVLGAGAARPVLTLFRGSAGLFGSAVPIEPTGASSGLDVTLVDADGDGDLDIVSVHRTVGTQAAATLIRIDVGAPGGPLTLGAQTTLDADRPRFSARGNLDGTGGEDLFLVEDAAPSSLLGDADATRVRGLLGSLSACVGDLDFDGWVQGSDLALLLTGWAGGAGSQGDLNGDGVVDAADVVQMLVRWGACAP